MGPGAGKIPNIKVERGGIDVVQGDKTKKAVEKINKLKNKATVNKLKAAASKKKKDQNT